MYLPGYRARIVQQNLCCTCASFTWDERTATLSVAPADGDLGMACRLLVSPLDVLLRIVWLGLSCPRRPSWPREALDHLLSRNESPAVGISYQCLQKYVSSLMA